MLGEIYKVLENNPMEVYFPKERLDDIFLLR
jgi:hypothetical protein